MIENSVQTLLILSSYFTSVLHTPSWGSLDFSYQCNVYSGGLIQNSSLKVRANILKVSVDKTDWEYIRIMSNKNLYWNNILIIFLFSSFQLKILKYLDFRSLLAMSLVCKDLYDKSRDASLWRRLFMIHKTGKFVNFGFTFVSLKTLEKSVHLFWYFYVLFLAMRWRYKLLNLMLHFWDLVNSFCAKEEILLASKKYLMR